MLRDAKGRQSAAGPKKSWLLRAAMPVFRSAAALQTRTTHGSPDTIHAWKIIARLVASAIQGQSLTNLLTGPIAQQVNDGLRGRHRDEIDGSGYVAKSLQAAIWAVNRTTSFRSAVLLAANLGDDADATAAVAGQFAGAIYGFSGIPKEGLEKLAWRERLEQTAARAVIRPEPVDQRLDIQLCRLAALRMPAIDIEGFASGQGVGEGLLGHGDLRGVAATEEYNPNYILEKVWEYVL